MLVTMFFFFLENKREGTLGGGGGRGVASFWVKAEDSRRAVGLGGATTKCRLPIANLVSEGAECLVELLVVK